MIFDIGLLFGATPVYMVQRKTKKSELTVNSGVYRYLLLL